MPPRKTIVRPTALPVPQKAWPVAIVGLDPSTKKIAAVITTVENRKTGTRPVQLTVQELSDNEGERLWETHLFVARLNDRLRGDRLTPWIYLEEPIVGPNKRAAIKQAYVSGCIIAACQANQIPCTVVSSGEWKRRVIGNGAAKKDRIASFVFESWPTLYKEAHSGRFHKDHHQDLLDAACINRFGEEHYLRVVRIQTETLAQKLAAPLPKPGPKPPVRRTKPAKITTY